MPLFVRGSEPDLPEWAAPLSPAEFAQFREQLDDALESLGYVLGDGFVTVHGRTWAIRADEPKLTRPDGVARTDPCT